ncbi:venom factor-like [Spea bombifrons]|uniref:venom factor-like n=1 Tax=Spea bombifrons TaxID=233779 RepID=UPI00234BA311|nr:venom factor-like [Spea bombifrons]
MGCRALCVTLLALLAGSYAQPPCTLITPSVLRIESQETIVIDAQLQSAAFDAEILIQDFPQKKTIYSQTKVSLNSANGFLGKASLTIPAKDFEKDPEKKQFVYVIVKSPSCPLERAVLVSFHSGYIFIQTDKPLYTPGSSVLYRIFTTGHSMLPDSRTVDVEIHNPDGIVVHKIQFSSTDKSGIVSRSFPLPEIANVGTWRIISRFLVAPQKIFRTEFEVKEYVLPSFEVSLHADQNFFYVNDNEFSVEITARFLHGNPVEGSAYAIFGALIGNEKKSIPDSLTRLTVTNGKATATLKRTDIVRRFHDMNTLLGNYLYVTVTVTTNADTDKVEAEMSGIPVVKTRFKLDFSKTSKYFKPGLSYRLIASLLNPDGSPAPGVKVCLSDGSCSNTLKDGTAPFNINNVEDKPDMRFEVQTKADNVPEHRQATGSLTVQAYKPQSASGNYLHIAAQGSQVELGSTLTVHFYFKNANMDVQEQIKHVTYLILSRGKIVDVGREARLAGQVVVAKTLTIKEDFVPSFRIVAYYVATQSGNEIVSDSAWVDVTDSCIRKVEISQDKSKIQEPGTILNLRITGDPGANVGLVAVDRAVYVLSRKNRLSQSKVWKEVEQSDLGCSPGGGRNNEGVFTDAGLSIDTTTGLKNPTRTELRCPEARRRRKRSVILTGAQAEKVKQYQDGRLRQCCVDGMQKNLMKYSCARRATYVMDGGDCVAIFLECCKFVFEPVVVRGRKRPHHHRSSILLTGEAATEDDDEEYIEMKNILSRSIFSESWLWRVDTLPMSTDRDGYSSKSIPASLPDSITTWEFLAISMSPTSGICVAQSLNVTVRKDFFIDLRLPYSVVRNEQVEIRVVLYSYVKQEVEVLVDLIYNKDMCSSSTRENNFRQVVKLDAEGSIVIPFVIVPLTIGELQVEVKALVRDIFYSDGVVKTLKVVPEGMRIVKTIQSIVLDPLRSENAEGVQRVIIDAVPLNDIVPNTEPETYVSVKGDLLGETLENSIDGSNLNHLIMVPSGCGEQNMMSMTPSVIATHYLDATGQWDKIGINRREEAIKTIQQGYGQQLVYRKSDNSYSAFTNRPSSTWLTAYVVKVFSMAFKLIYIERDVLCGAVKWLILNKQLPNGAFQEDAPVIHGEMVGGSGRTEPDASLTAFVLIALAESEEHCKAEVPNLTGSIAKSADYLEGRLKNLKKPYTVCIVSYALVLVGKLQDHSQLMKSSYGSTHWADASSDLYVIEATSYALLALLKLGRYHLAAPVVRWLTEQRFYGGGYGSTQATIMVFQALSAYQMEVPLMNDIKMDVSLSLPGRRETLTWRINQDNYMLRHSEKTSITGKISVSALGKGQGTLTVMSVYYAPMAEGAVSCKNFDFSVTLEDAPNEKKPDGVLKSMYLNICMRFQGITDSTMTIVDVSFLTGFKPDMEDLNTLTNRVERYISKFEMDTELSDRGSLIIYLDKVSRSEDECLKFKIHQHFEVGILQPAAVTIYEYYSLENRCTKFYHPTKEQGELKKICRGAECHCVAERCNLKNSHKGKLDYKSRVDAACEAGVDFVYECRLEEIDKSGAYDVYTMTVTKVIKLGSDEIKEASKRNFFSHRSCRDTLKLAKGRSYIIWGRSEDIWETKKEKSYVINGGSWIEEIPTNEDCAKTMSALCEEIFKFSDDLVLIGCPH